MIRFIIAAVVAFVSSALMTSLLVSLSQEEPLLLALSVFLSILTGFGLFVLIAYAPVDGRI